jgi:hypothetical protein
MKKLLIMALLAVGTMAHAEDYKYLTLGYNSVEASVELATLQKITFENGNVVVTTSNGTQTFPLAQMEKMYFSANATGIQQLQSDQTINDQTAARQYFDLSGRRISTPQKGIYIVNGRKVVIK